MNHTIEPQVSRSDIFTNGITINDIPGLINIENTDFSKQEEMAKLAPRAKYSHQEIFGQSCSLAEYIEVPVEMAFEYVSNVFSLEEYTATLRNFKYVGGGVYKGLDVLAPDTTIYMKVVPYRDSRVIDYLCAWDQGSELWMRYHWRCLDALPTVGKAGTVILWNNCRHPYYDKAQPAPDYVAKPRARTDRMWVGEFWDSFYPGHQIEAANLKKILEARWRKG